MSFTIWFTGIPISGKSTLAAGLTKSLIVTGKKVEFLDSDNVVFTFVPYLTSAPRDRDILARSMAITAKYLNRHDIVAVCSATSPRQEAREGNRKLIGNYIEVYCRCPLPAAEERDYKGIYKLARQNLVKNFTGIGEPYCEPENPEIIVDTDKYSPEDCISRIMSYLSKNKYIDQKDI